MKKVAEAFLEAYAATGRKGNIEKARRHTVT